MGDRKSGIRIYPKTGRTSLLLLFVFLNSLPSILLAFRIILELGFFPEGQVVSAAVAGKLVVSLALLIVIMGILMLLLQFPFVFICQFFYPRDVLVKYMMGAQIPGLRWLDKVLLAWINLLYRSDSQ